MQTAQIDIDNNHNTDLLDICYITMAMGFPFIGWNSSYSGGLSVPDASVRKPRCHNINCFYSRLIKMGV